MKKVFVLCMLLVISIIYAQTSNMWISGQAERLESVIVPAEYVTVNRERAACLIIQTDLKSELDFQANLQIVKRENPKPGEYWLFLSPGERLISIHSLDHLPLEIVLRDFGISNLRSGEVYRISLTGDKSYEYTVPVGINIDPPDSKIYIDGDLIDLSERSSISLAVGNYNLKIEKAGYRTVERVLVISATEVNFISDKLVEIQPVMVRITTIPDGARIFLDGDKGLTNRSFFISPGEYNISIVKSQFASVNEKIIVKADTTNSFTWTLKKDRGTLTVQIKPENAILFINDEEMNHKAPFDLLPGRYEFKIIADKYETVTETVHVRIGDIIQKEYELRQKQGTLLVETLPLDISFELYSENKLLNIYESSHRIPNLIVGNYYLRASADGYANKVYHVTIEDGKTSTARLELERTDFTLIPLKKQISKQEDKREFKNQDIDYKKFRIGFTGALNLSNISFDQDSDMTTKNEKNTFSGGLMFQFYNSKRSLVQLDICYHQYGLKIWNSSETILMYDDSFTYIDGSLNFKPEYNLFLFKLQPYFGLYFSYLIDSQREFFYATYSHIDIELSEYINDYDYGYQLGLDLVFFDTVTIGGKMRYGLNNIYNGYNLDYFRFNGKNYTVSGKVGLVLLKF